MAKYEGETKWELESTFTGYDGKTYEAVYTAVKDEDGNVYHGAGRYLDDDGEWKYTAEDSEDINKMMADAIENDYDCGQLADWAYDDKKIEPQS